MDGTVLLLNYSSYERQKIRHIIDKAGRFEIIEVGDLRQFKLLSFDIIDLKLIIMDLAFPSEREGLDVLQKINTSVTKIIPVIVISQTDRTDLKAEAQKYSVRDYIIKPFQVKRLEASIRSIVRTESEFHYDIDSIINIRMSFDTYVDREIKFSKRAGISLSMILITTLQLDHVAQAGQQVSDSYRSSVFSIAAKKAEEALRATDTIVLNGGRDIIIVLPCTDETGARLVCEKIIKLAEPEFKKISVDHSKYIYPVYVTFPEDGEDFQALMERAFKKVSDKEMLEKITSIPTDTRKYADISYNRYKWWP